MATQPAQFSLPFTHYAKLGYDPCPTEGKVPAGGTGWYTRTYTPDDLAGLDASDLNVGLRCSNIVGLDIDVDDPNLAAKAERVCRDVLKLPKTTPRRIGRAPKVLLPVRVAAPTKGFDIKAKVDGVNVTLFQVLGAGKQFVVHGTHPDTHKPYTLSAPLPKVDRLALVTVDDLTRLKAALLDLFESEGFAVRATGAAGKAGTGKWSDSHPWTEKGMEQAWEALEGLDPDMSMDEWVQVGFAIYDGCHGSPEGLALWDTWSSNGDKYKPGDCERRWAGFKAGGGVTRATLFKNTFPKVARAPEKPKATRTVAPAPEAPPQGDATLGTTLRDLLQREVPDAVWIIQDTASAGAMLLVGRPKGGKSILTGDMVFAVSSGGTFLGKHAANVEVLWIAAEDDEDQLARRLQMRRVTDIPDGVTILTGAQLEAERKNWEDNVALHEYIDSYLTGHPGVKFVIVDTQATAEARWSGDSAADVELRRSKSVVKAAYAGARVYQDIGLKHGACIVLVHHSRKRNGKDVSDYHELINMPMTVVAGVTSSVVLADLPGADPHDPKPERVLAVRSRLARDRTDLVELTESLSFTLKGDYRDVSMTEKRSEIMDAVDALQRELDDPKGWVPLPDIAEDCGIARNTLKVHLRLMRKTEGGLVWKGRTLKSKRGRGGGLRFE